MFSILQELGSQPLPTIVTEDVDHTGQNAQEQGHRPRAGEFFILITSCILMIATQSGFC